MAVNYRGKKFYNIGPRGGENEFNVIEAGMLV